MDTFFPQIQEEITSVKLIKDALKRTGLLVSIHAPIKKEVGKWNICSKDEKLRKESIEIHLKTIDIAETFNAKIINIHPGFTDEDVYDEEYYKINLKSIEIICDAAAEKDILISMEIMEERPKEFIKTPEDVMKIIKKLNRKNFGMTLDIVHAYTHGKDTVERYLKEIKKDIDFVFHCHVSGHTSKYTHAPFIACEIKDFWKKEIKKFVKFYNGAIVIEGTNKGKDLGITLSDEELEKNNLEFINSCL